MNISSNKYYLKYIALVFFTISIIFISISSYNYYFLNPKKIIDRILSPYQLNYKAKSITINYSLSPTIEIENFSIKGIVKASKISINYSPFKIPGTISEIFINDCQLKLNSIPVNFSDQNKIIEYIEEASVKNLNFKMIFNNLSLISDEMNNNLKLSQFSVNFKNSNIDLKLKNGDYACMFYYKSNGVNKEVSAITESKIFKLKTKQIFSDSKLIKGEGSFYSSNIFKLLDDFMLSSNSNLYNNLNEKLDIKFNISEENGAMIYRNITSNNAELENNSRIIFNHNGNITARLDIKKLNFKKLNKNLINNFRSNIFNDRKKDFKFFMIFHQLLGYNHNLKQNHFLDSIYSEINIDEILLNQENLLNTRIISNIEHDNIEIQKLNSTFQSGGELISKGNITHNKYRSIYKGHIKFSHNDLNIILNNLGLDKYKSDDKIQINLNSDLSFTPNDIEFDNITSQIDNINIDGKTSIKLIGKTPRIYSTLSISQLDINNTNYPLVKSSKDFILSLTKDMKSNNYLTKYITLRNVNYLGNFNITFNNLIFNDKIYDQLNFVAKLSKNNLNLTNFLLRQNRNFIQGNLNLYTDSLVPNINLKISGGLIELDNLNKDDLNIFKNYLDTEFELSKFKMDFDVNIDKLVLNNQELKNISLNAKSDKNILEINQLNANYSGGKLQSFGNILLNPFNINLAYGFNSFEIKELLKLINSDFSNITGLASINGKLSFYGKNFDNFFNNLSLSSNFISTKLVLPNFEVDNFIDMITKTDYNKKLLSSDMHKIFRNRNILNNITGQTKIDDGLVNLEEIKYETKYGSGKASLIYNIQEKELKLNSKLECFLSSKTKKKLNGNIIFNVSGNTKKLNCNADLSNLNF